MPRRIKEDHKMFRDVVSGTTNRELKKWIKSGRILRRRGRKGKIAIPIPRIDLPHFIYGRPGEGLGRGPGKDGDVVGEDPGKGKGNQGADDTPGDAIEVDIDLDMILDALAEELELPNLKPKDNDTFEEVKIRYCSLSKLGPRALLHKKKTLLQTLKRMSAMGQLSEDHQVRIPGFARPITPLTPIKDDERFRQWKEFRYPSSNAVIFFARDISGSMGPYKCDIVSDLSWWIDCWIQRFYEKVERCYVVHDTRAKEVDEDRFYKMRMGGGTICSSALKYISKQLKHRYPPSKWNVYVFYFSDGDNWGDDNNQFVKALKEELTPAKINLFGMTQILPWSPKGGLKEYIDEHIKSSNLDNAFYRTTGITRPSDDNQRGWAWWHWDEEMDEETRNQAIKNAIKELLGTHHQALEQAA